MSGGNWFFHHDGTQHGPVSFEELRQAAAEGQLHRDDLVWQEGMPGWVPAGTIGSLFEVSTSVTAAAPPIPPGPAAPPAGGGPSLSARRFVTDMPHIRLVRSFLDWVRNILDEPFLTSVDRVMKDVGHLAFITSVILAFIGGVVLAIKANSLNTFLVTLLLIPVALILQYAAVMFLDTGATLIEKSPSVLASEGFLCVYALLELVLGVVVLLVALIAFIKTQQVIPLAMRLIGTGAALYTVGIALSPQTVNISTGGEATAGEEATGILAFFAKKWLRLVPFLYGIGATVGALALFYLLIKLFTRSGFMVFAMAPVALGLAFGIALLPFFTYLVFLLAYVLIDLVRSVLAVPGKLDALSASREGQPAASTGEGAPKS